MLQASTLRIRYANLQSTQCHAVGSRGPDSLLMCWQGVGWGRNRAAILYSTSDAIPPGAKSACVANTPSFNAPSGNTTARVASSGCDASVTFDIASAFFQPAFSLYSGLIGRKMPGLVPFGTAARTGRPPPGWQSAQVTDSRPIYIRIYHCASHMLHLLLFLHP